MSINVLFTVRFSVKEIADDRALRPILPVALGASRPPTLGTLAVPFRGFLPVRVSGSTCVGREGQGEPYRVGELAGRLGKDRCLG
jgi:hypothetical protein